ncbi:MAG: hypothetical protein ACK4SJ_13375, partial [Sphingorhabdus sp.]
FDTRVGNRYQARFHIFGVGWHVPLPHAAYPHLLPSTHVNHQNRGVSTVHAPILPAAPLHQLAKLIGENYNMLAVIRLSEPVSIGDRSHHGI